MSSFACPAKPLSILKYVIVGDSAVGKSSILIRLTDDRFSTTEPTLGVEFGSRILAVGEEGKKVKVQCEQSQRLARKHLRVTSLPLANLTQAGTLLGPRAFGRSPGATFAGLLAPC